LSPEKILTTPDHELKKQLLHDADEGRTAELFETANAASKVFLKS